MKAYGQEREGPIIGSKAAQTSLLAPISTAKKYISELTVHHPLSIAHLSPKSANVRKGMVYVIPDKQYIFA